MSDAEDDYLSDKFLSSQSSVTQSSQPLTYAQIRRRAQRESEQKNVQNRKKSRRQLEEESTREGLRKSLFERAKEEESSGLAQGNKAMAMMMKMGFKPGQSLGKLEEQAVESNGVSDAAADISQPSDTTTTAGHLVEPLPVEMWSGRQGVGKRKRAVSPAVAERLAKVVKQAAETEANGSFRNRAKEEYEERRAEGRLISATRTCITLDEKAGKQFNVFWLNPHDAESFPQELLELLTSQNGRIELPVGPGSSDRLRQQMRDDALQPIDDLEDDTTNPAPRSIIQKEDTMEFPPATVEDARNFIRMNARDRLSGLLAYLREEHFYCFWCGTQYKDLEDLNGECPGVDEEAHD